MLHVGHEGENKNTILFGGENKNPFNFLREKISAQGPVNAP